MFHVFASVKERETKSSFNMRTAHATELKICYQKMPFDFLEELLTLRRTKLFNAHSHWKIIPIRFCFCHTHYHVCSLACFPPNAKGCLYDLSLQCLLRKLQFFRSKREEKEKRIILTRNASLKAYANISPIGKSFV